MRDQISADVKGTLPCAQANFEGQNMILEPSIIIKISCIIFIIITIVYYN
jgi:hypothetical protein